MADKIMYIPNDDTQIYLFCRLKLVVEKEVFRTLNLMNKPIKIHWCPQSS